MDWVTRKDALSLTSQWARRMDPECVEVSPPSYTLPHDRLSWLRASSAKRSAWWISKPVNASNSDGIRLLSTACAEAESRSESETVLQRYIHTPRTIGGVKFDLRLYVLVLRRGQHPPIALLYCDGLARFATEPYACPGEDEMLSQGAQFPLSALSPRAHLTNYSRQVRDDRGPWERLKAGIYLFQKFLHLQPPESPGPQGAHVEFIESPDAAGTGGVDTTTGLVLSHKWSARRALQYLDDLDASDHEADMATPAPSAAAAAEMEPRLWGVARRAIAEIVRNAASFEAALDPVVDVPSSRQAPETTPEGCSYELVGIDLLPDESGEEEGVEEMRADPEQGPGRVVCVRATLCQLLCRRGVDS
jgi:hypothetical protein